MCIFSFRTFLQTFDRVGILHTCLGLEQTDVTQTRAQWTRWNCLLRSKLQERDVLCQKMGGYK